MVRYKSHPWFDHAPVDFGERIGHAILDIWSRHINIKNNPELARFLIIKGTTSGYPFRLIAKFSPKVQKSLYNDQDFLLIILKIIYYKQ